MVQDGEAASPCCGKTNAVKWHIIFCSEYVSPNNKRVLWERWGLISHPFYEENSQRAAVTLGKSWACRKSPWQLCVLKRPTAHSQCHFIGCCGECFVFFGFKSWFLAFEEVSQRWDELTDICRKRAQSSPGGWGGCTSIQPLSWIWTLRNSANSFSMESGGFMAFFEDVNLNVQVLTCINMHPFYTMNYFVWGLIWATGEL